MMTNVNLIKCDEIPDSRSTTLLHHAPSPQYVDDGKLQQCSDDEDERHGHPHVDGLDIGDTWQLLVDRCRHRRHRQYVEDAE